ncbi:MAG TPA: hypothetical protein VH637_03585 [Streptosporangiaceae bacterium]
MSAIGGQLNADPAGNLDEELAQLSDMETLVAEVGGRVSNSTCTTFVCSGHLCCF